MAGERKVDGRRNGGTMAKDLTSVSAKRHQETNSLLTLSTSSVGSSCSDMVMLTLRMLACGGRSLRCMSDAERRKEGSRQVLPCQVSAVASANVHPDVGALNQRRG